jgi:hypothetical protein
MYYVEIHTDDPPIFSSAYGLKSLEKMSVKSFMKWVADMHLDNYYNQDPSHFI